MPQLTVVKSEPLPSTGSGAPPASGAASPGAVALTIGGSGPNPEPLNPDELDPSTWGNRWNPETNQYDGAPKGPGFLGTLRTKSGNVATEISVGVKINGKETEIPTLVPTLTAPELNYLLSMREGDRIPKSIIDKAVAHARERIGRGESPFLEREQPAALSVVKSEPLPGEEPVAVPEARADGPMDLLAGAWQNVNPIGAVKAAADALPVPIGENGEFSPAAMYERPKAAIEGILGAHQRVMAGAQEAFQQGNYPQAARKVFDWLLPVVGPMIDEAVDKAQSGQPYRGAGELLGAALGVALPEMIRKVPGQIKGKTRPLARNPDPAYAGAIDSMLAEGTVPDAGTATGNAFVRGTQALSDRTALGSIAASRARTRQAQQMTARGEALAAEVHPTPVSPVEAGQGYTKAIDRVRKQRIKDAKAEYAKVNAAEADPANVQELPQQRPASVQADINARSQRSLGRIPHETELAELRGIKAELEAVPYEDRTWTETGKKSGNAAGGDYDIAGGHGNAGVFRDIVNTYSEKYASLKDLEAGEELSASRYVPRDPFTGPELQRAIESALETGKFTQVAKAALDVANERLGGRTGRLEGGRGMGLNPTEPMQSIALPVDLAFVKPKLRTYFDELEAQQRAAPGSLQGDKAVAYTRLKEILEGPDYAPLTVVDSVNSSLKRIANSKREAPSRGRMLLGQATRDIDAAIKETATGAGVQDALEAGRAATVRKYAAIKLLQKISGEPVRAFNKATQAGGTALEFLREVKKQAPKEIPKIGRAFLQRMIETSTQSEGGGFTHAQQMLNKWNKLGADLQAELYGPLAPKIAKFWQDAAKLAKVTNASESALVGVGTAGSILAVMADLKTGGLLNLGAGALSKLLHSEAGVRALTQGIEYSLNPGAFKAGRAYRATLGANIVKAAEDVGVYGGAAVPAAADAEPEPFKVGPWDVREVRP